MALKLFVFYGGFSMNVDKLHDALSGLSELVIRGAVLSPGELQDTCLPIFLRLAGGTEVGFVEHLGPRNIPDDWQTRAKEKEVVFDELSDETIAAARQGLRDRIRSCDWTLSSPYNLREQLLEQGVGNINRINDFLTVALCWQINVKDLRFHVLSARAIPLYWVLGESWMKRIFAQCKA